MAMAAAGGSGGNAQNQVVQDELFEQVAAIKWNCAAFLCIQGGDRRWASALMPDVLSAFNKDVNWFTLLDRMAAKRADRTDAESFLERVHSLSFLFACAFVRGWQFEGQAYHLNGNQLLFNMCVRDLVVYFQTHRNNCILNHCLLFYLCCRWHLQMWIVGFANIFWLEPFWCSSACRLNGA